MNIARLSSVDLHWREDGDSIGLPVVFANSLGTDLRLWDKIIDRLPQDGFRLIRFDKRGHGLSSCPPSPYSLEDLVQDTEDLLDHLGIERCVFVGLSIGGQIGQLLAHRQPQLVQGLVLANTGSKMGETAMWQERISLIREGGIEVLADAILERWFSGKFRQSNECIAWRHLLTRTPMEGYIGCCEAISRTDLTQTTSALSLPAMGIGGSEDLASPPALVRATTESIQGSRYVEIEGAGHLPCVEAPDEFSRHLMTFLKEDLNAGSL
ncbi:3-oxoadipate enol-lactonase 2 [Roseibium album]|nr:3-oxoadipate enol-lactonase 2 [Roseibium album]